MGRKRLSQCSICKEEKPLQRNHRCLECHAAYQRQWRQEHPGRHTAVVKSYYQRNREKVLARVAAERERLRDAVFAAYGDACACCGESDRRFLTVDHIIPPASKTSYERKAMNRWLKTQGYPGGFQILCWNCNMAKGIYGACPHAEKVAPAIVNAVKGAS